MKVRRRNDGKTAKQWGITKSELWERRRAGLKGCGGCREWLPLAAFGKDSGRSDGLHPKCRQCAAEYKRKS